MRSKKKGTQKYTPPSRRIVAQDLEITLRVRERQKRRVCELCGTDQDVQIVCGGPFGNLCPRCHELAAKVIKEYLRFVSQLPLRLFIGTVHEVLKKERDEP
jgi:hypothetical protein